jgi:hypothetical protein
MMNTCLSCVGLQPCAPDQLPAIFGEIRASHGDLRQLSCTAFISPSLSLDLGQLSLSLPPSLPL